MDERYLILDWAWQVDDSSPTAPDA